MAREICQKMGISMQEVAYIGDDVNCIELLSADVYKRQVYILNPELIDEIPEGEFFHITHLMEKVKTRGGRVGCFPVSEDAWKDMGEWPEYLKMIKVL